MEHEIVNMDSFEIIGIGLACTGFDTRGIPDLWELQFFPRIRELNPELRIIGACLPAVDGFHYVAAAEMPSGSELPQGMEQHVIPAARWFTMRYLGKPAELIMSFAKILHEHLPAAGLKHADGPICLEIYPQDCWNAQTGEVTADLYVQLED
jgi:predicted transcriptional regulator YdeE